MSQVGQLSGSGTSVSSWTDATYPPGVLCFLIEHMLAIKEGELYIRPFWPD